MHDFNNASNKKTIQIETEFYHARIINDIILNLEHNRKLNFTLVKDLINALKNELSADNLKNMVFD